MIGKFTLISFKGAGHLAEDVLQVLQLSKWQYGPGQCVKTLLFLLSGINRKVENQISNPSPSITLQMACQLYQVTNLYHT